MSEGGLFQQFIVSISVPYIDKQCNLSTTCGYLPDGKDNISDVIYNAVMGKNISFSEAVRHSENGLDYIPSTLMLDAINSQIASDFDSAFVLKRIFADDFFKKYDYIIFDNKTALDILTQNALNASDYYILPVEAGQYAFDGIEKILSKASSINATTNPQLKLLGILYNRAESRTNIGKAVAKATEALSNYYFANDESFRGITVPPEYSEQFERLTDEAMSYYEG